MHTLKSDRPFGVVYGHPAVAFEQDGHQFGPDKVAIDWDSVDQQTDLNAVASLDAATAAIERAKQSRSEAIKAGLARKRAQVE